MAIVKVPSFIRVSIIILHNNLSTETYFIQEKSRKNYSSNKSLRKNLIDALVEQRQCLGFKKCSEHTINQIKPSYLLSEEIHEINKLLHSSYRNYNDMNFSTKSI